MKPPSIKILNPSPRNYHLTIVLLVLISVISCKNKNDQSPIAESSADLQQRVSHLIKQFTGDNVKIRAIDSSVKLNQPSIAAYLYKSNSESPIWSEKESWKPVGDSLFYFISQAKLYGLFPEDYHHEKIKAIRDKFLADTTGQNEKKNSLLWADAEILMTDAFVQIIRDLKLGRLPQDSISLRKDSVLTEDFYLKQYELLGHISLDSLIISLEPKQRGYHLLKAGIKNFLDSSDDKTYSLVPYPEKDPVKFQKALQKRLFEEGYISYDDRLADSAELAHAVLKFQKKKGMAADGRAGEGTVRMLNVNDREKFLRIAISMDKYKMLPENMPAKYVWVNTSSNELEMIEKGEVSFKSKVICGKAKTRTPLLTSQISQIITYPQWVPPPSIVSREILPACKRNPGYLERRGFHLQDSKGNTVDPYTVNWAKYKTTIPYRIVQGSGDANALGIMKFVFDNKYSVYLHDTNQRYLFNNNMRNLSHGCVRVQEWEKLTYYILRNDSLNASGSGQYTSIDSLNSWIRQKQKKNIPVRHKMPVFIRYFTCEGQNGHIIFYDDVYSEDKLLREKYFAAK